MEFYSNNSLNSEIIIDNVVLSKRKIIGGFLRYSNNGHLIAEYTDQVDSDCISVDYTLIK